MSVNTSPGPVVDEARVLSIVSTVTKIVALVGVLLGIETTGLDDAVNQATMAVLTAVAAVWAVWEFAYARYRAWRVRDKVTPVDNPRDDTGRELVPANTARG